MNKNNCTTKAFSFGNSMHPLIKTQNKLVISVAQKNSQKYHLGDIVVFIKNSQIYAHRVIKIKKKNYIIKGDNNLFIDNNTDANDIIGKVEKIIHPQYTINLNNKRNQALKYIFILYSRLNLKFPFLIKLKKLYKIRPLKKIYRLLIKS